MSTISLKYKAYSTYKSSGVEWLGEIPEHWEVRRLKYLATVNDEVLDETTDPDREIAYVDIGNVDPVKGITGREDLSFKEAPSRARRIVRRGDVIVSTVRTYLRAIARIEAEDQDVIVSTGFAVIRPRLLDGAYVAYAFRSPYLVERVVARSTGVGYPAINASDLACLEVALPSPPEQRAIAAFLDRETVNIDVLIAKYERLIELLQEKRTALVTRSVTKGLNPDVPMKHSDVESLGQVPAHWEIKRLSHLAPSNRPIMYGIVLPGPHIEDGVPIIKGGDVSSASLSLDALNRTAAAIESRHAKSRLKKGDLVYAIRGSIGDVAMVPGELEGANLTQDAARVAYRKECDGLWLLFLLRSRAVFAQLESDALGATIRGINIRDLRRTRIPVPPQNEQQTIAEYVNDESHMTDDLIAKISEAIDRLKELRIALISAAVTGRIDVRGETN